MLTALTVGLLLVAVGCSSDDDGTSSPNSVGNPTTGSAVVKAPVFDKDMPDKDICGIFTKEDFEKLQMTTIETKVQTFRMHPKARGVTCEFAVFDNVSIGVFPDVAVAKAGMKDLSNLANTTAEAISVPGADEASFGTSTLQQGYYSLVSRRGKLMVFVNMEPKINGFSADEARTAATALTQIVYERAPKLA
ncbi:hypothetical protein ACTOB_002228 [Actinoplanes oblitus]|uniref:DUF3558 domain-containing protein n=1 Tax=Actinoplanes oblitus TaxID=3040509 RepID=A0ABY8WQN1_9ACTN|nr:hypothetical protein [Actinoplanes oblitus]WIM98624.1 hypothetical protein ACTOB_002228 [Actinoplanes oblitus]